MPRGISPITGYAALKRNMTKTKVFFRETSKESAEEAADSLLKEMKANANRTEYTLADLRRMGHPYARAHPNPPHDPFWLVHRQKGTLLKSIKKTPVQENPGKNKFKVEVGADEEEAPHARWVIMGTPRMISRDFVTGTYQQQREDMIEQIRESFKDKMFRRIREFLRI